MAARPHERMAHHQAHHVGGALPRAAGAAPQGDMHSALRSDVRPRELWGWAMYDFANSGYSYTTWLTDGDHRRALLLTGSYFVVGLFLLPGVRVARGRRAALRIDRIDRIPISNPTRNNAS